MLATIPIPTPQGSPPLLIRSFVSLDLRKEPVVILAVFFCCHLMAYMAV